MLPFDSIPVALLGALHPALERGLVAAVLAARALGAHPRPVCTSIISASDTRVTDVTEVPADTVQAQLEHLFAVDPPEAVKLGVLGTHATVEAAFSALRRYSGPMVLEFVVAGDGGGTVLSRRGVEALRDRLDVPDLVLFSRTDAELISGGEIQSLDDAQVAAQRLHRLGAKNVLITCGEIKARFFDLEPDGDQRLMADLLYDGEGFSLFEAPYLDAPEVRGASSALSVAALAGLSRGIPVVEAVQEAKRYVTEALRLAQSGRLRFDWPDRPGTSLN